jgi:hypothetical protein
MKLKTVPCAILLAIAAAAPLAAHSAETAAATAAKLDSSHEQDLRAILDAEYLFEFLVKLQPTEAGNFEQEFMAAFRAQASREEMMRRLLPAIGKEIPPLLAAQVERQVNNAIYRKRAAGSLRKAATPEAGGFTTFYSEEELQTLRRIDQHPAMTKYLALQPRLQAIIREAIGRWSMEFAAQLNGRAADAIEQVEKDLLAAREANDGRAIRVGTIGFEPWDFVIAAYGQCAIKFARAFEQQEAGMVRLNYSEFLRLRYLADKQHLEQAPGVIDQAEAILESTLTSLNAAVKEREQTVGKSSMLRSARLRKQYEEGIGSLYTYVGDYGETVRLQLARHRQLVSFMQSQIGNTELRDGLLAFGTEEARLQALELLGKLQEAQQRLQTLNAERVSQDERAIGNLRQISRPPG